MVEAYQSGVLDRSLQPTNRPPTPASPPTHPPGHSSVTDTDEHHSAGLATQPQGATQPMQSICGGSADSQSTGLPEGLQTAIRNLAITRLGTEPGDLPDRVVHDYPATNHRAAPSHTAREGEASSSQQQQQQQRPQRGRRRTASNPEPADPCLLLPLFHHRVSANTPFVHALIAGDTGPEWLRQCLSGTCDRGPGDTFVVTAEGCMVDVVLPGPPGWATGTVQGPGAAQSRQGQAGTEAGLPGASTIGPSVRVSDEGGCQWGVLVLGPADFGSKAVELVKGTTPQLQPQQPQSHQLQQQQPRPQRPQPQGSDAAGQGTAADRPAPSAAAAAVSGTASGQRGPGHKGSDEPGVQQRLSEAARVLADHVGPRSGPEHLPNKLQVRSIGFAPCHHTHTHRYTHSPNTHTRDTHTGYRHTDGNPLRVVCVLLWSPCYMCLCIVRCIVHTGFAAH